MTTIPYMQLLRLGDVLVHTESGDRYSFIEGAEDYMLCMTLEPAPSPSLAVFGLETIAPLPWPDKVESFACARPWGPDLVFAEVTDE